MQYSMPYAQPMGGMQGASPFMQAAPGGYGGMQQQGFAQQRGQPQPFGQPGGMTMAPQTVNGPLTPKPGEMPQAFQPQAMPQSMPLSMNAPPGSQRLQQWPAPQAVLQENPATFNRGGVGREQALEQRVRELESVLLKKDQTIQDLQAQLQGRGGSNKGGKNQQVRSPGRGSSGFRKVGDSKPIMRYTASDQDDPIDVRLEEFYNSTGSAIQFRRINRGFYRFGDSIVELDIINHKLMARTEDGWNRGKFGPVEKFLMYYENIEREKAGILPEA